MVYHIKLFPVTSLISFLQKFRYLFLWGNIKNIAIIGILCWSRCQIKADHLTEQENDWWYNWTWDTFLTLRGTWGFYLNHLLPLRCLTSQSVGRMSLVHKILVTAQRPNSPCPLGLTGTGTGTWPGSCQLKGLWSAESPWFLHSQSIFSILFRNLTTVFLMFTAVVTSIYLHIYCNL